MKKIDITPQELCERLFKGERFYNEHGAELFFDGRFKGLIGGIDGPININNWFGKDIYTKPHWTDNLSKENPVLCWLRKDRDSIGVVVGIKEDGDGYTLINGQWCSYAEPVKLEDACIWEGE